MKQTLTLLFLIILLPSCIREKFHHCYSDQTVSFVYYGDGDTDILEEKITNVHLYIYDKEERLIDSKYSEDNSNSFTQTLSQYQEGEYKLVTIANLHKNAQLKGTQIGSLFSDLSFNQASYNGVDHAPIYYAEEQITVTPFHGKQEVILHSLHYRLKVNVKGYDDAHYESKDMLLRLNDFPSGYLVDNEFINIYASFNSNLTENKPSRQLESEILHVLREEINSPLEIELIHKGKRLIRFFLSEIIKRNGTINLKKQELDIPLDIIIQPASINLQIQSWVIEDYTPEFN